SWAADLEEGCRGRPYYRARAIPPAVIGHSRVTERRTETLRLQPEDMLVDARRCASSAAGSVLGSLAVGEKADLIDRADNAGRGGDDTYGPRQNKVYIVAADASRRA